jgi:hypothetical protein
MPVLNPLNRSRLKILVYICIFTIIVGIIIQAKLGKVEQKGKESEINLYGIRMSSR